MINRLILYLGLIINFSILLPAENILVIYSEKVPVYEEIVKNFAIKIIADGHKAVPIAYGEVSNMIADIKSSGVTYAFCVGGNAANAAFDAGVKGVFTMVVDPIKSGLIDTNGLPLGGLTGVLINVNPRSQFSKLKGVLDVSHAKAGIIYNPGISRYVVSQYKKFSATYGFSIMEYPVSDEDEVADAAEQLKRQADFIMAVVDNTVYNIKNVQLILKFSHANKIPMIGFSPQQVKAGALMGFYCDYPKLGDQSAALMKDLIKNSGNASMVPVQLPDEVLYSLNKATANVMRIDLPEAFIEDAHEVFG